VGTGPDFGFSVVNRAFHKVADSHHLKCHPSLTPQYVWIKASVETWLNERN
jgi:hypothetical protein